MIYKNLIFTNHALERMKKRSLDSEDVYQAISYPENILKLEKFKKKYIKKIRERNIQVVVAPAKQNPEQKLVVSVWVRGENDKPGVIIQIFTSLFKFIKWIFKKIF